MIKMKQERIVAATLIGSFVLFQNCAQPTFSQSPGVDSDSATSIVCDGVATSDSCNPSTSKVTAEIFSLSADARAEYGSDGVDTYFNHGDKVAATVLFDEIFVPTRHFSDGFPTSSDTNPVFLENADGERLTEYFGMRLKTNLSLTVSQGEGLYQLALLSDDGSRLVRLDTGATVVDNNTTHPTEMGCGQTVSLKQGQTIPIEVDYYQGPADEIALTFMWRKVTSASALSDPLCGQYGNETFFGPNLNDFSTAAGYGRLLSRGWSVVSADNLSHQVSN